MGEITIRQRHVAQRRNALWSELLNELSAIVAYLRDHPEPLPVTFRMADFANFALKVGELWGCREAIEGAFAKLEGAQAELALEKDPIHQVLSLWLADETNHNRRLDAGPLHKALKSAADQHKIEWPFQNGKALGQRLGQLQFALREQFEVDISFDAHSKQNRYAFAPKQPQPENASLIRPAEPEEVLEFAEFAGIERG